MTDEPTNGNVPPTLPLPMGILQVFLMPDKTVEVQWQGAAGDPLIAYGMLLKAHDRLKDYYDKMAAGGMIVTLPPGSKLKK